MIKENKDMKTKYKIEVSQNDIVNIFDSVINSNTFGIKLDTKISDLKFPKHNKTRILRALKERNIQTIEDLSWQEKQLDNFPNLAKVSINLLVPYMLLGKHLREIK